MVQDRKPLALVGEVEDALRSEVVDLQSLADGVIEVDTRGCVENHFDLLNEKLAHLGVET